MDKNIAKIEVVRQNLKGDIVQYDDPDGDWTLKGYNAEGICLYIGDLIDHTMDPESSDQFARETGRMEEKLLQFFNEEPATNGKMTFQCLNDDGSLIKYEDRTPEEIGDDLMCDIDLPDEEDTSSHDLDALASLFRDLQEKLTPSTLSP